MNILIFSWRGIKHPYAGGAEISTLEHAKGWVARGHNVTLFTSMFHGGKEEEIVDGVKIIRKGFQVFGVHIRAFFWYLFSKHIKYDLVIDEFHGIPFFTPIYVRVKKLGFIHEVTKEVWSLNPWPKPFNLIPSFIGTLFEPLVLKLFYKNTPFMTVSESTKKDLIKWGVAGNNIAVVYNGVTLPKIASTFRKEKKPTIIFLGAISKDKGIEEALLTFSKINNSHKEWKFWIVGKSDESYMKKIRGQIMKLSIKDEVIFYGFVDEDKKFELLSRAHLLVNTSIREGWGLVVIEAASVGVPTIAFNSPGLRDSIQDGVTGLLCKHNNPDELSDMIISTLENKELYRKLSMNAYIRSKNFSWVKSISDSLRLIKEIVD